MALRELLLPWDAQPQEAVRIDPTLNPVLGFSAPFGFNDIVDGSYYTAAGSGLSIGVNNYGREMDGGGAGMLKRPIAAPAGHPYTCIGIARQDVSGGTKCVSSLATSADKFCRVFLQDGKVLAQHSGATTYGNALTTQVFYYGTSAIVVAAFDSPSSVRVWARGLAAEAYAENTTNVGSLPALTLAAVMGYSGSADISQLDGGVTLAAWLRLSPTEQQAREWLANPWQIFAPRRIWVPVAAGGGGSWSVSLTESASASDSLGAATTALVSLIESASAADIITAATIAAVALTEAASASDTQTASYSSTGSGSVTESASASDTLDAANTMLRALTETASADDQLAAATTMLRAISESASASDDASASYTGAGAAAITETASATDALTAAATLLVTILEAGNATDALAAATTMVRAITEQATAVDEVTASLPGSTWDVSIEELAAAVDLIAGYAAGGLTVSPLGLRLSTTARQPRLSTRTR